MGLDVAVEAAVVAVVVALLATGRVDADSKDTEGQTPLSKAAEGGHEAVAAVLLATGRAGRCWRQAGSTPARRI
jgi:ankyrin repeat protein